jgi:hypothetical protein
MATPMAVRAPKAGEPVVVNDPAFIDTPFGPVVVFGHHLVSKKDLVILGHCLNVPDAEFIRSGSTIKSVIFRDDNRPKDYKGIPVLGNVSFDHNSIAINLVKIVGDAIEEAINNENVAVVASYHRNVILTILHEIHHLSSVDSFPNDPVAAQEEEDAAESWAQARLFDLVKMVDMEPAHHSESPALCMPLMEILEDKGDNWAVRQKNMLDNHMFFHVPENVAKGKSEVAIFSFKEYMKFQAPDFHNEVWNNDTIKATIIETPPAQVAPSTTAFVSEIPANHAVYSDMNASLQEDMEIAELDLDYDDDFPMDGFPAQAQPDKPLFQQTVNQAFAPQFQQQTAPQFQPQSQPQYQTAAPQPQFQQQAAPQSQAPVQRKIYQDSGFTDEQTGEIVKGVYYKIYNHIFGSCGPKTDSDIPFENPELVYRQGIPLTADEQKVIMKMDCFDVEGRLCDGTLLSESKGMLHGKTTSNIKLPAYKIYINMNGFELCRYIFPQNTAKPNKNGGLTKPALEARAGKAILYIKEGNDAVIEATGKTWLWKIVNGEWLKGSK